MFYKNKFVTVKQFQKSLFHRKKIFTERKFEKYCEAKKDAQGSYYWAQKKISTKKIKIEGVA